MYFCAQRSLRSSGQKYHLVQKCLSVSESVCLSRFFGQKSCSKSELALVYGGSGSILGSFWSKLGERVIWLSDDVSCFKSHQWERVLRATASGESSYFQEFQTSSTQNLVGCLWFQINWSITSGFQEIWQRSFDIVFLSQRDHNIQLQCTNG